MHARIKFNVDGKARDALFFNRFHQRIQQTERINLGLEVVIEHGFEGRHLGIHDHNAARDAVFPQGYAFVCHCNSQIIHAMVLQCLGDFNATGTVGIGLDHAYELGFGLHKRAIAVQVLHNGIEINLQRRFMHLPNKQFRQPVETETPCPFDENHLVMQLLEHIAAYQLVNVVKEILLRQLDACGVFL